MPTTGKSLRVSGLATGIRLAERFSRQSIPSLLSSVITASVSGGSVGTGTTELASRPERRQWPSSDSTGKAGDDSLSVCLLSYRSDPHSGGQGVYVRNLARALTADGHTVDVISGPPYPDLPASVGLIEIPRSSHIERDASLSSFTPSLLHDPLDLFEWASRVSGGFPEPFVFGERVRRYFERTEPVYDVVHDNQSLSYGLLALEQLGYPTVVTVHHPVSIDRDIAIRQMRDPEAHVRLARWYRFVTMQQRVARRLDHIITVSHASASATRDQFDVAPDALEVIHNGIDTTQFRPNSDSDREPTRIMTTASADTPIKGLDYLLQAFARLTEEGRDLELVLVGGIDPETPAADLIWWLGIQNDVCIHSDIETDRMAELYSRSALAVVPSVYEGFGLPAGEAMACGVPLVATTGGGLPEVVGDAALTVPPRDVDALADAIRRLLDTPELRDRLGKAGYERIRSKFQWEQTARETVDVYRQAIADA